jgi:hypothetical protein
MDMPKKVDAETVTPLTPPVPPTPVTVEPKDEHTPHIEVPAKNPPHVSPLTNVTH